MFQAPCVLRDDYSESTSALDWPPSLISSPFFATNGGQKGSLSTKGDQSSSTLNV